ncbi:MAG: xanthine dehydrogenase family protein molybdopterin-binding subunit [Dehalococcoidia bacterium]
MTAHRYEVIGQRLSRVDGLERVTGRAAFGADLHTPGVLHGAILHSPHAHAVIKRIDDSKARALTGVKAVITGADFPEIAGEAHISGNAEYSIGAANLQRLWMAKEKVFFEGHPLAAVAATDRHIAEEAINLIDVEYEILPQVDSIEEALAPDAPLLHEGLRTHTLGELPDRPSNVARLVEMGRGDVHQAFETADVVIENEYRTQRAHQGYIEPQASTALVDPSGHVTVWTSMQAIHWAKGDLSALLNIPHSKLRIVPLEVGGGFGGKVYPTLEPLCVLLSRKSGQPVKMVLSRDEVLRMTGPTSGTVFKIKTACAKDGTLTAIDVDFSMDAGAFPGSPVAGAALAGFSSYRCPNIRIMGRDVVTNRSRVQAYRGPGTPQACFALEQQLEQMAKRIGMDPLEMRLKNIAQEGDLMTSDRPHGKIGFREVLERVKTHPAWTSQLEGPWRGRGLACGMWMGGTGTSSAHVVVNGDGSVSLLVGSVDLTGTRTSLSQIAAEEFGLTLDRVQITVGDTEMTGFTDPSGGSRITYSMGDAVHRCCQDALRLMRELVASQSKVEVDRVAFAGGVFRAEGDQPVEMTWDHVARLSLRRGVGPIVGLGSSRRLRPAPTFGAHVADVEVDPETGKVTLLRYTVFQDCGLAVNPTQVEGQMQGGAAQGIGWALFEEFVYEGGTVLNRTLLDYRMPTALDLPMIDAEIVEVPAEDGPYGVRGCGEVPIIPPIAAIANAVANATGVRIKELPLKPETVFWAMREAGKT